MCTQAAKKINGRWFLIKTRDPVRWMRWDDEIKLFNAKADKYRKLIVQNPDPNEDGYYGGINEKGVAYISTFVRVAENQISYIRRPYVRLILEATTAEEAVKIIRAFNPRIGGNMFVADQKDCYGIEGAPDKYYIEEITKPSVKTNHFIHLPYPTLASDGTPAPALNKWSQTHYQRATELIQDAQNLEDLKNILRDRKNADQKRAICTTKAEDECCTYSAFIFDTKNALAYYCQGNPSENDFRKYRF